MLFKGTQKRSCKEIAIAFDSLGAEFNAFTDKEDCCFYADFLDNHLDKCFDILQDVLFNPSFSPGNIRLEKKVIKEEIQTIEDDPSDDVFNYFYKAIFGKHRLSLPIIGSRRSINNIKEEDIKQYYDENFSTANIVISATGNIRHDDLVRFISDTLKRLNEKPRKEAFYEEPKQRVLRKVYFKKNKAANICYGTLGCNRNSKQKYPLALLVNVLGGSMSSRLFQKIREDKGLAYSVYSQNTQYVDSGLITIFAATSPKKAYKVVDLIEKEIKKLRKSGISQEELEVSKENIKGSIVLSFENISSRMFRLGKSLTINNKIIPLNDILSKIDKINMGQIKDVIDQYFEIDKMSYVMLGEISKEG
jgi:predicted Zn-dependent peptidase